MVTRSDRLAEFVTDRNPPEGMRLRLLCEDHNGTYELRFACVRAGDGWKNSATGDEILANVVGWDFWSELGFPRRQQ